MRGTLISGRANGFGTGVLLAKSAEWTTFEAYAPPGWRWVSLVPTPEMKHAKGAEIRYAVLSVHINMLILWSAQLDREINAV